MSARFKPELFRYLADLAENNERPWFKENQDRYEQSVKEPALDFIEEFRPRLEAISPHFRANARAVGGSLFRIHRDTRFSKDKTPYKLNTGLHFRHERAKDAHAPGFYLHLQPRACFMAMGMWHPEPKVAQQIRQHISDEAEQWQRVVGSGPFASGFELAGDSLVRPPKGMDRDHPLLSDLKRKDFIATMTLSQADVTKKSFMDTFEQHCRSGGEFMAFLCTAVGVPF